MELYLGSIIEPIRKSIRNTLYFNSKHTPKMLGEAMQKAQDLHIKHLYAIGEDQDSVTSSSDVLPGITINEVTSREDRGWYKNKCKREVDSATKCDTWVFYTNNGESNAVRGS